MNNRKIVALCDGAVIIAISSIFSLITILQLPQGGSISLGMLPIFIYNYKWGYKNALIVSFANGVIQLIMDGAIAYSPWSLFLDYILAYGVLGVSGFFNKKKSDLFVGPIVASALRFIAHFISGITVYKIYAPTILFNYSFTNPYVYSLVYNGSYILLSLISCLAVIHIIKNRINIYLNI